MSTTIMTLPPRHFEELIEAALPPACFIPAEEMPAPYRKLLDHRNDMTGTLQSHYGESIHLRTLEVAEDGDSLYRLVLLSTESGKIVEFGAIRINLAVFDADTRAEVTACRKPLGGILNERGIAYRGKLVGLLTLHADERFRKLLELDGDPLLYGRRNRLETPDGRLIAEVVEILPVLPV
jgi:hypothetical protein